MSPRVYAELKQAWAGMDMSGGMGVSVLLAVWRRIHQAHNTPGQRGPQASMGSVGDSFDHALAENLWTLVKTECIRGRVFATRAEANLVLFEYIDGFHNPAASRSGARPYPSDQTPEVSFPRCVGGAD
ncbi:IS3 family transposase [Streptomyces sp. NPDC048275]|uniref:IS3 family transposase n=1 Tax=Streptomyces sp. NPDC048275 TaxID=3155629 RepID=UPI0033C90B59